MHAKMVKSISLEDNGDIKKGDTVWMIAIQATTNIGCDFLYQLFRYFFPII